MQVGFIIFFNLGNWRVAWGYWMALVCCISIQTVNAKQFMLICAIKCDKIQMFQTFLRKLIVITSRIQTERSTIIFFLCFKSTNVFWRIRFQKYGSFGRWALILKSPTGNRRVANQRSFSCRANHFNVKLLLLYIRTYYISFRYRSVLMVRTAFFWLFPERWFMLLFGFSFGLLLSKSWSMMVVVMVVATSFFCIALSW